MGAEIKQLHMRRPKVSDLRASAKVSGGDAEKEIRLFANLCEVTPSALDEMDVFDYQALQEVYQGFLSRR